MTYFKFAGKVKEIEHDKFVDCYKLVHAVLEYPALFLQQ